MTRNVITASLIILSTILFSSAVKADSGASDQPRASLTISRLAGRLPVFTGDELEELAKLVKMVNSDQPLKLIIGIEFDGTCNSYTKSLLGFVVSTVKKKAGFDFATANRALYVRSWQVHMAPKHDVIIEVGDAAFLESLPASTCP
jgi:hypothetical protein